MRPREEYLMELETILQVHDFKDIQKFPQILKALRYHERDLDEVQEYLDLRHQAIKIRMRARMFCSECGAEMYIFDVNNQPAAMIGGPWRSMWQCRHCGEEILSKKTAAEEWNHRLETARREAGG